MARFRIERYSQGQTSQGGAIVWLRAVLEWLIRKADGDATFYPPEKFGWAKELEAAYPAIRHELEAVLRSPVPSWESLSGDPQVRQGDRWRTFILYAYGKRIGANCSRCPSTELALQRVSGMTTAWLSILAPHSGIPPHEGPFNGVLRAHLGLMVPSPDPEMCGIRVGKDVKGWEEGRLIIFDDTHDHAAWNRTDGIRVVLFIDFLRPLPFPLGSLCKLAVWLGGRSAFIHRIVKNAGHGHQP